VAVSKEYPDELRARAIRLYREPAPKPVVRQLAEQDDVDQPARYHHFHPPEDRCTSAHDSVRCLEPCSLNA